MVDLAQAPKLVNARRVLVVGGTGMLGEFTLELCDRAYSVTSTGRSRRRLAELQARCETGRGNLVPVIADWTDETGFFRAIEAARGGRPFDVAVVWMHGERAGPLLALADMVRTQGFLLHVRGSASVDPVADARRFDALRWPCAYREVSLGFAIAGGRARWLTHGEICRGVTAAFDGVAQRVVVGIAEPWSARP